MTGDAVVALAGISPEQTTEDAVDARVLAFTTFTVAHAVAVELPVFVKWH